MYYVIQRLRDYITSKTVYLNTHFSIKMSSLLIQLLLLVLMLTSTQTVVRVTTSMLKFGFSPGFFVCHVELKGLYNAEKITPSI